MKRVVLVMLVLLPILGLTMIINIPNLFILDLRPSPSGYSLCRCPGAARSELRCGEIGCPAGCRFIGWSPNALSSCDDPFAERQSCGTAWTKWITMGKGVGNPCSSSCVRGREIGQKFRVVNVVQPQVKHQFECWY
jgi:hypothetical protein